MLILNTAAALDEVADPNLRPILDRYGDLMDLATIYIVTGGDDDLATLEHARGRPFDGWEFLHENPGGWYEAVIIRSDDGAGDVILVPDRAGIDPALLNLCRQHAEKVDGSMI